MLLNTILIILGLLILVVGAEILVKGSASLARKMKIPPLVIGLTIVAFGTSAPEMTVNIFSAVQGASDLALGNVIGSSISNILLILGVAAIINPIQAQKSTVHKEIPFSLLAIIVLLILGNDMRLNGASNDILSLSDSLILLCFFSIFLYYVLEMSLRKDQSEAEHVIIYGIAKSGSMIIFGLVFLIGGGKLLVDQSVVLARSAGISEALIGLTIVAVGTSLPELATSVVAAFRRESDIAIGNVVGSNIFNIFWILGVTGLFSPLPFNSYTDVDLGMAMFATVVLFVTFYTGEKHVLRRPQGFLLLCLYAIYIVYLINRG